MLVPSICAVFVTLFVAEGYSESIQCYTCDDCHKVNNSLLQPCPVSTITLASADEGTTILSTNAAETTTNAPETTTTNAAEPPEEDAENVGEQVPEPTLPTEPTAPEEEPAEEDTPEETRRRKRQASGVPVSYHCFTLQTGGGEGKKTSKGCVEISGNRSACSVLKDYNEAAIEKCITCSENRCNGSGALERSSVTLAIVVVNVFFLMVKGK